MQWIYHEGKNILFMPAKHELPPLVETCARWKQMGRGEIPIDVGTRTYLQVFMFEKLKRAGRLQET